MNQILYNSSNNEKEIIQNNKSKNKKKRLSFFKFQFIVCTILMIFTVTYYIYTLYENTKKENVSKKLLSNFNIISLYSTSNTITTPESTIVNKNSPLIYTSEGTDFSVIGVIEIKKIQLNYPIISTYNDELLKIAPCRFFGPMPNEIGNLCIAGHNYNSYKFFSKLKNLSNGDLITLYDLSR